MKRYRSLRLPVVVSCLAALLAGAAASRAAIVGPAGYTNSFDALPVAADWATSSRSGGVSDNYDMDLDVQTNIAAAVVTTAITSSTGDPAASSLRAVWSSTGLYVQTRPTGNRYSTLMGKFVNGSGSNAAELVISYQMTFATNSVPEEPGRGTRVYYSYTGNSNTWVNLAALNTVASNGVVQFSTNLSVTWLSGSNLYVLFADDNCSAGTDVAVELDNFSIAITAGLAPTVSAALTAPANNGLILGGNPVTASIFITNGSAPYVVRYYTNAGAGNPTFALAGTVSAPPHTLGLGVLPPGTYNLYATVTDDNDAGTTAYTATNTFTVADLINFAVTAPADNASFDYQTPVNGTVSLSGGTAPFAVQWFLDGAPSGAALTTPPYSRAFGTLGIGDHTISATVTDSRGWVSNSAASIIHVTGPLTLSFSPTNGTSLPYGTPLILVASAIGGTPPYTLSVATNGQVVATGPSPLTTNVGLLPPGAYTVQASATDGAAAATNSPVNTVTITPNPLGVTLTAPTNGHSVVQGLAVTFSATTTILAPLVVTNVEFYIDGVRAARLTTAPYATNLTPAIGAHSVYALAQDNLGRSSLSGTNQLIIQPPPSTVAVGPAGYTNDFSTQPQAYEFGTLSRAGAAADTYVADTDVNLNITSALTTNRPASTAGTPPNAAALGVWANQGFYLQTRPTGNRYTALMGRFENRTGTNATEVNVSYQLTLAAAGPSEDAGLGLRAYYSLSGATGSWVNIPAFNTTEFAASTFNLSTNLSVNWTNGGTLFILWTDDNGASQGTDTADQFDNFSLTVTAGEPLRLAVAVTTPASNSVFVTGAPLTAAANVFNGTGPYTVEYFTNAGIANPVFTSAGTNGAAPFNVALGTLAAGAYNIYASVTDANTNRTNSVTNTFYFASPIAATLAAPANNASIPNTVNVTGVVAVAGGRAPYSVQFYLDSVAAGSPVSTPPYEYDYGPLFVGDRALRAQVTDSSGWSSNTAVSVVHITGRVGAQVTPFNGATFVFGESINLTSRVAGGTAPYDTTLFLNGTPVLNDIVSDELAFGAGALAPGSYSVYASVSDFSAPVQSTNSTTNVFTVLPNPITVALTAPTNGQSATAGVTFNLAAGATVGAPLAITNVQFYYDGALLGSDVAAPYTGAIPSPAAGAHAVYAVAVDSLGRAAFSATNTVTFVADPLANNNFANRFTLGTPASVPANNTGATTEGGEPTFQFGGGQPTIVWGATLWYKWVAPFNGTVTIDTFGSAINTVLSVYTGSAVNALTVVQRNGDANGSTTASLVSFNAAAGTEYQIQLAGNSTFGPGGQTEQGAMLLNLSMPPFIAITNPVAGSVFMAGTPFQVDVVAQSPAGAVTNLALYSGAALVGVLGGGPLTFGTFSATNLPPGSNSLYAVARDTAGQVATSAVVRVLVAANGLTITSPQEDNVLSSASPITFAAYSAPPSIVMTNVQFLLDGQLLGSDDAPPFSLVVSNVPGGSHRLTATGRDSSGNSYFAAAVNFGVSPQLIASNSVWKYLDNGSDQGTAWSAPGYDDSGWASGPAPLGYSDSNGRQPLTTNSFGPDTNAKYTNTYYRQSFVVSNRAAYTNFVLGIQRDDGAVVYLNGVELARYNMPVGPITSTTFASGNAADDGGTTFTTLVSPSLLIEGVNVVAVEIHQDSANSSDIWFGMELAGTPVITKNVPPEVAIHSPTNSQYFVAPPAVTISATATDSDGSVTNVEFYANGVKIGESAAGNPYQFNWNNPPVAAHSLTAVAVDNLGTRTVSQSVPIVVYDSAQRPVVAITSPADGAVMEGPTNLLVTAAAYAIAGVTNVQFLSNGVAFANVTAPAYAAFWTSSFLSNELKVIATDALGVRGTSPVARVTITIPPTNVIAPFLATQLPAPFAILTNLTSVAVTFSERVQGVDAGDLLVNSTPATSVVASPNGSNYVFFFPQPPYGEVEFHFPLGHGITDFGYPAPLPFDELLNGSWEYFLVDRTVPTITARTPAPGAFVTNLTQIAVTFSEGVAGVDASDLLVNGVPAFDLSGSGSNYVFQVSQPVSGPISITWATNHAIYDFADVPNSFVGTAANSVWSFTLDSRTTFIESNSVWRFVKALAEPSSPTNAWRQPAFDDSGWSNALAPFYFGDPYTNAAAGIIGTHLTDMRSNYSGIYLRKTFQVANRSFVTNLQMRIQYDDGFVASINGGEVLRVNMNSGETPYTGTANSAANEPGGNGAGYVAFTLTGPVLTNLVSGTNIFTVHALNQQATNDDFAFNLQLYSFVPDPTLTPPRILSASPATGEVYSLSGVAITFDEDVTNVHAADLLVNGVPATGLSSPSNSYHVFTFAQPAYGEVTLSWAAGHGITDLDPVPKPFDGNAASARLHYLLLNSNAPVVLTRFPAGGTTVTGLTGINISFNKGVTGVNASDLLINGVPAASVVPDSDTDYFFFFPQPGFGPVNVRFATNNGIVDLAAGNAFDWTRPSNQWSYTLVNPIPVATITTPTNSTYILAPATVPVNVTATDGDGTVTLVEFYSNGAKVGEDAAVPYSLTLSNLPEAGYVLRAVATDNQGVRGTSAPVVLNVVTQLPIVLLRGPYLQSGTPSSIVVRWRTDQVSDGVVRFGTSLNSLTNVAVETTLTNNHVVFVTGLQPDTKYFYAFGSSGQQLAGGTNENGASYWFRSSPVPGTPKPTRFWVLGDPGTATPNQVAVRDAYLNMVAAGGKEADLWLMLGDNAYNTGTDTEYQNAVFNMYPTVLRNQVLWPVIGNHDAQQPGTGGGAAQNVNLVGFPYLDMFTLPQNGEAGGLPTGNPKYYSFDYGNIHFVGLDSMTSGRETNSPMVLWLKDDLSSHTQTWTIVYFHHSLYTHGTHNSDTEADLIAMRQVFNPILDSHGVDLVLMGHSHVYERSYLIDGHYGIASTFTPSMKVDPGLGRENGSGAYRKSEEDRGVVYSIVGSSGQALGGTLDHPAHAVSLNLLGSLLVDVSSNRLDAIFLTSTGTTNDYYTLVKRAPGPAAPTNLVAEFVATNQIRITWSDVATDETGYVIERAADCLNYVRIATNAPNTTQFLDTGLLANTTYCYRVRARNGNGDSTASNVATGSTAPAGPLLTARFDSLTRARTLTLSGTTGVLYSIDRSTNLADNAAWQLWQSFVLTNSPQTINAGTHTNGQLFYRARQ